MYGIPISWIISGIIALGAGGYIAHCQWAKNDREQIITTLRTQAQEQKQEIERQKERHRKAKEDADNDAKAQLDRLQRDLVRLRNDRTRTSSVPPATASARRPELACFDRAEFGRTVGNLEAGMEGLVAEGAEAAIGLNSAREWAKSLNRP